MPFMTKIPKES